MRTAVLALLILTASASTAPAQAWAEKMFKDGVVHDFGTVPRGAQLFFRFPITNIYAVRMDITNINPLCTCVTATPSKTALEPRETAFLDVNMDTRRFVGLKVVNIRVSVGPQFVSTAELRVSANSRADIVCNPSQINFGAVAQGTAAAQTLSVEYAGVADWRINEVTVGDVPVKATLQEKYRRPGQGVGYDLQVTLNDSAPAGTLKQDIFLKTNDPATPLVPVLIEANVQTAISVSPSELKLAGAKVGEDLKRRVVVRATRPFVVRAIDGMGNDVSLGMELSTNPALVHILSFKIKPSAAGDFRRELLIKTSLQEKPLVVTIGGNISQ